MSLASLWKGAPRCQVSASQLTDCSTRQDRWQKMCRQSPWFMEHRTGSNQPIRGWNGNGKQRKVKRRQGNGNHVNSRLSARLTLRDVSLVDDFSAAFTRLLHLQRDAHALLRLAETLSFAISHPSHDLRRHRPSAKHAPIDTVIGRCDFTALSRLHYASAKKLKFS